MAGDGACPGQFITVGTAAAPHHTGGSLVAARSYGVIIYFHSYKTVTRHKSLCGIKVERVTKPPNHFFFQLKPLYTAVIEVQVPQKAI